MNQHVARKYPLGEPLFERMPPCRPLDMPAQDFTRPFLDPDAPQIPPEPYIWAKRATILLPTLLITVTLGMFFAQWLSAGGLSAGEIIWLALICATFFWVSFVFCLSLTGAVAMMRAKGKADAGSTFTPPLNVAILMPVYNEDVADVFASILAMQDDLDAHPHHHSFSTFILSDSQDPQIITQEMRVYDHISMTRPSKSPLYYRRRDDNQGYKAGNLHQWVRGWGAGFDAMLVLDADSLMSADAILKLTNTLARNPAIGLIQGALHVFRGRRLFARLQQFSNTVFNGLSTNGLHLWSGNEGTYFGHNAIIRTRAFAACAGLPGAERGKGDPQPILSHDFVEAALLRRAGWGVKILPDLEGSFEQAPETLIDYIHRDRRWCQGNMQHLRIMGAAGLHPISRFHMFLNALGYLMSPTWLVLILIWSGYGLNAGSVPDASVPNHNLLILVAIFAMLLAPKFIGAVLVLASAPKRRAFGGVKAFAAAFVTELVLSMLIAPILMIHQTISIGRSLLGLPVQWGTPTRSGMKHSRRVLIKFHAVEAGFGCALGVGMLTQVVSPYFLPISVSLMLAPFLSHLSSIDFSFPSASMRQAAKRPNQYSTAAITGADMHRKAMLEVMTHDPVNHARVSCVP